MPRSISYQVEQMTKLHQTFLQLFVTSVCLRLQQSHVCKSASGSLLLCLCPTLDRPLIGSFTLDHFGLLPLQSLTQAKDFPLSYSQLITRGALCSPLEIIQVLSNQSISTSLSISLPLYSQTSYFSFSLIPLSHRFSIVPPVKEKGVCTGCT